MKSLARSIPAAFILLLLCTATFATPTPAETFKDKQALGQWLAHFYQAPEPELVSTAILSASKLGMFEGQARSFAYFGFIAGVMSKYPDRAPEIAHHLVSLPPDEQPALVTGLWYSSYPGRAELLKSLSESMPVYRSTILYLASNDSKPVFTLPVEDGGWVLDVLWGFFMATGDERAVARITDALQWLGDPDQQKAAAANAAKLSLTIQGKLHPPVLAIVKTESHLSGLDPKIRAALSDIQLDAAKK